ncbi:MAG: putative diguanylate cyclase YdaM [Candidatus Dichloromethanomonas elyunquensis]|nr:MAG: putative diguanylate cyclase YdaM [Candidatus Dichloromethanomonas elyunquensis]
MEKDNKTETNKNVLIRWNSCHGSFVLLSVSIFLFINEDVKWFIIPIFTVILFICHLHNRALRKKYEEKNSTEKVLKHSEQLFRGIFNNAAAGIALLDKDGYYQHANLTLCKMLGYTEEELKATKFQDITYPSDLEKSVDLCERMWDGTYPWANCEKRYICKNGDVLWAEVNMSAIRGDDQEIMDIIVVVLDITVRRKMEQELIYQATTDFLTGVDNRLSFMQKGREEFSRSQRYDRPFTLLLLDVDHFKWVNDIYGHLIGDRVLRDVVTACKTALRETDILARVGGEEFAVILIESEKENAYQVSLRIQQKVKEVIVESGNNEVQVTVSIGIGIRRDEDQTMDDIFRRADDALYKAKNSGRDRIVFENSEE